jgi:hypothetical protein
LRGPGFCEEVKPYNSEKHGDTPRDYRKGAPKIPATHAGKTQRENKTEAEERYANKIKLRAATPSEMEVLSLFELTLSRGQF